VRRAWKIAECSSLLVLTDVRAAGIPLALVAGTEFFEGGPGEAIPMPAAEAT
jgi:hypothetical protein